MTIITIIIIIIMTMKMKKNKIIEMIKIIIIQKNATKHINDHNITYNSNNKYDHNKNYIKDNNNNDNNIKQ